MSATLPNPGYCGLGNFLTPNSTVRFLFNVDRATNGSTSLESAPTLNQVLVTQVVQAVFDFNSPTPTPIASPVISEYQFLAGNKTTSIPSVIVPLDNPGFYWSKVL